MQRAGGILSIRLKVGIAIMLCILGVTAAIYVISTSVILKSYELIEHDDTLENVERVTDALQNSIDQLNVKLVDWAFWDDSYQFIEDKNMAYAESNLGVTSLSNLKINGMVFVNAAGVVVFQRLIDYTTLEELPGDGLTAYLAAHPEIVSHTTKLTPVTGLIMLPEGPALLASEPLLTSEGEGPAKGTLIFIKYLTTAEVDRLSTLTHLTVTTFPYADPSLPLDVSRARDALSIAQNKLATPLSGDIVAGYAVISDVSKQPILLLRILVDRTIYQQGKQALLSFSILLVLISPLFGLLSLLALQGLVFSRLNRLNGELAKIGAEGKPMLRVLEGPPDELGAVEAGINVMLNDIASAELDLEKFKLAVENADEHVIITDPAGKVLYANASAELTTGYPLSEMLGHTPSLWGGQMPPAFYKKLWKTISKDKLTFTGEVNNRRKNGELYVAAVKISPILDAAGNVRFFVGLEEDITEERQAQADRERYALGLKAAKEQVEIEVREKTKELSEERARFLASVNSLQIGFTIVDITGALLITNPALGFILGPEHELATLTDLSRVIGGGTNLAQALKDCTEKHCVVDIAELSFGRKYLRIFITPVFAETDDGQPLGGAVLIEDITEAKAIEKAKSEFVSLASHQLRTPLSTVNWYIELIQSGDAGKLTPRQQELFEAISVGNHRMVALVDSLLDVSRLELGHLSVTAAPVSLQSIVREVVADSHQKAVDHKLTIHEAYDEFEDVSLDIRYIRMVVENVLDNALNYTPSGGVVDVKVRRLKKAEEFGRRKMQEESVGISVSDTGYGIPEHQQKRVFQKLFRGDNVLDKPVEGTGLGLYIVKEILEQSGGAIWFDSKENVGTTFYITLPLAGMKQREIRKPLA